MLKKKSHMTRRGFMGGALSALAGAGMIGKERLFGADSKSSAGDSKIKKYRKLGRTGFKASDISMGTASLTEAAVLESALDAGMNYIDTAPNYMRGRTESIVGSVIKSRDRKSLFVTTKLFWRGAESKETLKENILKSLERLQTDFIDCLMIHAGNKEKIKYEPFHEAIKELKTDGKVRFIGLSNHGVQYGDAPERMDDIIGAAAEDGRFDVVLFVYNFLQREMGERILKICHEKNIGTTLMKINPVLEYTEFKEYMEEVKKEEKEVPEWLVKRVELYKERVGQSENFKKKYNLTTNDDVRDAAVKFVLSHPHVNSVTFSINSFDAIRAYVALSGLTLESKEKKMLADYDRSRGKLYCRHACGECEPQCPHGVPVNTIMRYNHYFRAQNREKQAMLKYKSISGANANVCSDCFGPCEKACAYGVPIHPLLLLAHQTLTLV